MIDRAAGLLGLLGLKDQFRDEEGGRGPDDEAGGDPQNVTRIATSSLFEKPGFEEKPGFCNRVLTACRDFNLLLIDTMDASETKTSRIAIVACGKA